MKAVLSHPAGDFRDNLSMSRNASIRFFRDSRSSTSKIRSRRISLQLTASKRSIRALVSGSTLSVTRGMGKDTVYTIYKRLGQVGEREKGDRRPSSAGPIGRFYGLRLWFDVLLDEEIHVVHRAILVDVLRVVVDGDPLVGVGRPVLVGVRHPLRAEGQVDLLEDAVGVRVRPLRVEAQVRGHLRHAVLVLVEDLGTARGDRHELWMSVVVRVRRLCV